MTRVHHRTTPTARQQRIAAGLIAFCLGLVSCAFEEQHQAPVAVDHDSVGLLVLSEAGQPVVGARVDLTLDLDGDGELDTLTTDRVGTVVMDIDGPVVATVSTPDTLPEPVAVSPTDRVVTVRLWDRVGPSGVERHSLHFGGDVMLGRRYLTDESGTVPVVDEATARAVVDDLAPITRAADWTTVNLESVIGRLDEAGALDARPFPLQSTPLVTAALDEMGVDLVTLGNDHAYDWGEVGIKSTADALDLAGIEHVGAGGSPSEALAGRLDRLGSLAVGTISVTTVDGNSANDRLPVGDAPVPADLPVADAWQYQERTFGFDTGDELTSMPEAERRAGDVWSRFAAIEDELDEAVVADAWNAMTAVYPELQDWVAGRGHGGAAGYDRRAMETEIQRLREAGARFVTVQVHGGYQFAEVESGFVRQLAHRAIDAGADLVVAHHPHVLQGLEWYRGKLVAYSLGNLVFDHEWLDTFPSMIARVVTEGPDVLEVRLLPLILDRYRPVPVVGRTARTVLRTVDLRSSLQATSRRVHGRSVGTVLQQTDEPGVEPVSIRFDRNSGVVERGRVPGVTAIPLDQDGLASLPPCALVRSDRLPDGIELGVDLLDWSRFDDDTADDRRLLPLGWKVSRNRDSWSKVDGASGRMFDVALELRSDPNEAMQTRFGARIDISRHRWFNGEGLPVDGMATYELTLDVKRVRGESPSFRILTFGAESSVQPDSDHLVEQRLVLHTDADGEWHRESIELPAEMFEDGPDGVAPKSATIILEVPPSLLGSVAIDNVQVLEWRDATDIDVPVWVDADAVRGEPNSVPELEVLDC